MLSKAIENVVNDYVAAFIGALAEKFTDRSQEEMVEIWMEVQKGKKPSAAPSLKKQGPKRTTPYLNFQKTHRPALKEKGLAFGDIAKELGRMWRNLTDEEKEGFRTEECTPPPTQAEETQGTKKSKSKKKVQENKTQPEQREEEDTLMVGGGEAEENVFDLPVDEKKKRKKVVQQEDDDSENDMNKKPKAKKMPAADDEEKSNKRPKVSKTSFKMPTGLSEEEEPLWEKYSKMKNQELKELCDERAIKTGSKMDMIAGLVQTDLAMTGFSNVDDDTELSESDFEDDEN